MIRIGNIIVSEELFDQHFICDLVKCQGNCCIYGDAGAPLEEEESLLMETSIDKVLPFMRAEGKSAVSEQGTWVIDYDGEKVTPLVEGEECAYVYYEQGIARCAIERAHQEGALNFQKPVSCHLYPIRVSRLKTGIALNYHRWSICEPARLLGRKEGTPVFRFLKEAIVRVYGRNFYDAMERVYQELNGNTT
jgi:hypothetical protein